MSKHKKLTGGPKTAAGKARSAMNAVSHGLTSKSIVIDGVESQAEWEAYRDCIVESLQPDSFVERDLAEDFAACCWRLKRVPRIEAQLLAAQFATARASQGMPTGTAAKLAEHQRTVDDLAAAIALLKFVSQAGERAVLDGADVVRVLDAASDGNRGLYPSNVVPPESWEKEDFPGWTAGRARTAVGTIAQYVRHDDPIAAAIERLTGAQAHLEDMIAAEQPRAAQIALIQATLPDSNVLQSLPRYEVHLSRRAISVLHELEVLQRARISLSAQLAPIEISSTMPEGERLLDISRPAGDSETSSV
jgi:hypothetical protein